MQCLTYARVSTGAQADRQLSIPAQLFAIREYAHQRGWSIVEEFIEDGVSGRTATRPSLLRLLARCRQAEPRVNAILVHKLDRIARNLADHVAIQGSLKAAGVRLISTTEQLEDSVSGRLVEHVMASIAEFYSANLSEEVKKGMAERVRQGGWPHLTPAGYRRSASGERARRIEIDPVRGPLIRELFERWSQGDTTQRNLCDWLSRQGLPTSKTRLSAMLRNPFYCGRMVWKGQEHVGNHPALVSRELFDRVQLILQAKRQPTIRRSAHWGPLHGLAFCECGGLMSSVMHKRRFRYYRCRRAQQTVNACRQPYAPEEAIHQGLLNIYAGIAMNRQRLHALRKAFGRSYEAAGTERRRLKESRTSRLQGLLAREMRLAEVLADGLMEPGVYRLSIQRIRQERDGIQADVPQVAQPLIPSGATTVLEVYLRLEKSEQEMLFREVFEKVTIDDRRIRLFVLREAFQEQMTAA